MHLKRDRTATATAKSFEKRYDRGIIKAYEGEVIMGSSRHSKDAPELDFCLNYVDTVTTNINHFLRDKTNVIHCRMERSTADFSTFWDWIGANGDRDAALAEWTVRHNAS